MTTSDFSTVLLVDQTPKEVFDAINHVRAWWSVEIQGSTDKLNDEFFYHYKDVHHCKMKLIEIVPDKKVAWLVMDNYFNFTKDKSEWKGTKIIFDITEQNSKTQIRFTHEGLVPEYECYDICLNAWTGYIQKSLKDLITTGKGKPNANSDYQKIIIVNKPVNGVYKAITEHISEWWSNDLTGNSAVKSDRFNIAFGETRKTFEIVEAIPNKLVVWNCVKSYIDLPDLKNKAEWEGTKLIWVFNVTDRATTLFFLHEGFNQSFECYSVCASGWDSFLASLADYLDTGKGSPYLKNAFQRDLV